MLKKREGFTLIEIMIVVMIIAMLLAIAVPNFMRARDVSRSRTCQSNLRQISAAKDQWAMDNRKGESDEPLAGDLVPGYIKGNDGALPGCPTNGTYEIGTLSAPPACSIGTNSTADTSDDHIYLMDGA